MARIEYPIGGYAPGNYQCTCCICGNCFYGDKRAVQCEPCAIIGKEKYEALSEEEKVEHENRLREAVQNIIEALNKTT